MNFLLFAFYRLSFRKRTDLMSPSNSMRNSLLGIDIKFVEERSDSAYFGNRATLEGYVDGCFMVTKIKAFNIVRNSS